MQALRVSGIDRVSRPNGTDPSGRLDDAPDLVGVEYPLALVEWHDAWFDHDQLTIGDRRSDYVVRTVGFLIDEGPRVVSVAQELLPEGEGFRAVTHIPVAVVERIVRIWPRT
ncbi:MAG TPA: hypothetical protein VFM81_01455 [Actinomycetota bacterium]|nr:hypothetical protein [Actinomycetota bacterium]